MTTRNTENEPRVQVPIRLDASMYNKFKIKARMGEAFVDFWFGKELAGDVRIKGKIKRIRGDKTTQLNYVKISG